jgi:Rps23 Pro-64 3,4-dihydroxylase Tpa1-like proline 4-hydroxylase
MEKWKEIDINFADDFLSRKEHDIVADYCLNSKYDFGEVDDYLSDYPPTGMVHEIPETHFIYKLFRKRIHEKLEFTHGLKLYRMYVNVFAPGERPYFHQDGEGLTFLYYPNFEWDMQWGGETQFIVDNNINGIVPAPNRLVFFDGMIWHRATSFRDRHRFTLAIKYQPSK